MAIVTNGPLTNDRVDYKCVRTQNNDFAPKALATKFSTIYHFHTAYQMSREVDYARYTLLVPNIISRATQGTASMRPVPLFGISSFKACGLLR